MNLDLKDKVAMVAASSKGLGFGVARALAREGAQVSMGSRSLDDIKAAAGRIHQETRSRVEGFVLDASSAESIRKWTNATAEAFGRIDCLLVNAGGPPAGRFDDFGDEQWQGAFELTMMSAVRMIRNVLPHFRARGAGSILVITSSSVKEPIDNLLLSNVLRAGVTGLVKSLSRELAPDGIRVNNLVPGRFDTDRVRSLDMLAAEKNNITLEEQRSRAAGAIPMGRYGSADELGNAAAFLLSDAASYVTGETFVVDGGAMRTVW